MKLFFVAGEPSGDRLGAALLQGFEDLEVSVTPVGVGGPGMGAKGLNSQFNYEELAVMGLAEVLPKYFHLKRRISETAEAVLDSGAEALITIDSPDFCLRVAKIVREKRPDFRTIHYVAPSVWAWRPGRADKMAKVIDHVLALLPFEPPYMEAAGMGCDFVGHPVVTDPVATEAEAQAFRDAHGIGEERLILVLPGSRRSEVARLAPIFGEALAGIDARLVLPATANVSNDIRSLIAGWDPAPIILDASDTSDATKRAAFRAADGALAASGTVSLELAASGTPMVIAYDMAWLTKQVIKRVIRVDTVTLVNLVSETRAVPEFLADNCIPDAIRAALEDLDADAQRTAMAVTMERLGAGGPPPGRRAAEAVMGVLRP